jgi:hypothetical protein
MSKKKENSLNQEKEEEHVSDYERHEGAENQ